MNPGVRVCDVVRYFDVVVRYFDVIVRYFDVGRLRRLWRCCGSRGSSTPGSSTTSSGDIIIVGTGGSASAIAQRIAIASVARSATEVIVTAGNVTGVDASISSHRTSLADGAAALDAAHDDAVVRVWAAPPRAAAMLAAVAACFSVGAAISTKRAAMIRA